jgi:alpha-amylase/alpha-mannosidase (GH57 family)
LHATKDYLDMALRLGRHPGVHATFNFVPSLLDQLESAGSGGPDALFDLLRRPVSSLSATERAEVLNRCCSAPRHAFERWPAYRRLCEEMRQEPDADRIANSELLALEVWFLLAWLDPMFHGSPEALGALAPARDFTPEHRDALLDLHGRLLQQVIPAYRELADLGQIELTESAYYHPILPLLVDLKAARRARPELELPAEPFEAPEDAARQVERALERHARAFGHRPLGMWPPEGSVSPEAAEIMARAGIGWFASDEGVLWNSLPPGTRRQEALYQPWKLETAAGEIAIFFRDHELSDRIGFVYQNWHRTDAVTDFLGRIRRVAREYQGTSRPVVSVMLDGENCWEGYPEDGGPFLDSLYAALESAPDIRTRTPSEVIAERNDWAKLPRLHSGSWINADFRVWIGHQEKNRAWDLLGRARRTLVANGITPDKHPSAWEALFAAEGSDWFWWFGDDHYTSDKKVFDQLFREHLRAVYERSDLSAPAWLQVPVTSPSARRSSETQPLGFIRPTIDGRHTDFYEWHEAGRHKLGAGGSSMHRPGGLGRDLYFGFDEEQLYLRLDFAQGAPPGPSHDLLLEFVMPRPARLLIRGLEAGARGVTWASSQGAGEELNSNEEGGESIPGAQCRIDRILELGLPFASLGLEAGESVEFLGHLLAGGEPIEIVPVDELVRFTVPDAEFEAAAWSA